MSIEVKNLNVYIKDNHILKNINLTLPEKKITCIIGPSGCGKSTLLKTLNRLIDSVENVKVEGNVFVDGEDIINSNGYQVTELRRKIGLVNQRPCPLPMSIYANVAYGCRINNMYRGRKLHRVVCKNLEAVGLWNEVNGRLRTPAVRLSIGQQQRLCLARSLAVEPEYILADEATSALDPISAKKVEDLFVSLKDKYSIIMVTHTLRQAVRIADHVVFMFLGEIIEEGPADQIFNNPQQELTKNYLSGAFS
ncbi:MAG: phosphate ABC transporter ATP-binding protein [Bacteroidales bacterium]|nr:phosphate ABC transporter ATP-binding protein [Bacteroidales bacterium]